MTFVVELIIDGKIIEEVVQTISRRDAELIALADKPTAKVISTRIRV